MKEEKLREKPGPGAYEYKHGFGKFGSKEK
jgi:hypothetical protein